MTFDFGDDKKMDTPVRQDVHIHLNVCKCLDCQHEFTVAQEPGKMWYDCPECKATKGHLVFDYVRPEPHLKCHCGNVMFRATEKFLYCPNCGENLIKLGV